MSSLDPAVKELLDHVAIESLLSRYARAVDGKDLAAVAACFTPDASYKGSLGEGPAREVLAGLGERWERYRNTMHFLAIPLIEVHGDTATSDARALVVHRFEVNGEERDYVVGLRYVDELERRGETWLIRRRVATLEWQRVDPVVLPPEAP
jgi:3-phenylpropionate/cinnamic acid dioxygenase small subunit